ncbi:MAG: hypothetical protein HXY24_11915 [Rubrivivax sp.]|nr:hypothetical protein [Rubrivivax sp.]
MVLPAATEDRTGPVATAAAADWWDPAWHLRLAVAVDPLPREMDNPLVVVGALLRDAVPAGQELDPDSPRVICDGRLVPATYRPESDELSFRLPGAYPAGAAPRAEVYFDTLRSGPKQQLSWSARLPGTGVADPGFERRGDGWLIQPPAGLVGGEGHTGRYAVRLQRNEGMGPVVVQTASVLIEPSARYKLVFWAKTSDQPVVLRTNLYHPSHDAPALAYTLQGDGQWHRYEGELTTGAFHPNLVLMLRFWLLEHAGTVLLDDVELTPIGRPATPRLTARVVGS